MADTKFKKGQTPWNKGIPMSEEAKGKMIEKKKGVKLTEEHKAKISKAIKERPLNHAFVKGMTPWNKGIKSNIPAWNKGLKGIRAGEENHNWKGDEVGYSGVHSWVKRKLGKPKQCAYCGAEKKKIEYANIDHKYRRDTNDYVPLCTKCHRNYDYKHINAGNTKQKSI